MLQPISCSLFLRRPTPAGLPAPLGQSRIFRWAFGVGRLAFRIRRYAQLPTLNAQLLRIQLHDQLLLDRHGDVVARRRRLHRALEAALVEVEPRRDAPALHRFQRLVDADDLAALLLHRHDVADLHLERRDVHLAVVHPEVAVAHELPRLGAGVGEAEPEDHVVEALLEVLQKIFAGLALRRRAAQVVAAELRLEQAVEALHLLLFTELHAVLGELGAPLAVLARRIRTALDGALVRVAAVALQVHLQIFAPADAAGGLGIAGHLHAPPLRGTAAVVGDRRDV